MRSVDLQSSVEGGTLRINDHCVYRHSPGRGVGVFASKSIRSGDLILQELERTIPGDDKSLLMQSTVYNFLFVDPTQFVEDPATSDLRLVFGAISIVNHAERPNSVVHWRTHDGLPIAELYALRKIEPGEEIFHKYGNVGEYSSEHFI